MATSSTNNSIPKCSVRITDTCLPESPQNPNGALNVNVEWGPNLYQYQLQTNQYGITPAQDPCCKVGTTGCAGSTTAVVLAPDPSSATGWEDVHISAYCDLDESINNAVLWDGVTDLGWQDNNGCGISTLASDTAIYFFYDTTSLDDTEQSTAYVAANNWVANLRATGNFTGKVYHLEAFGERWILWPAWIFNHSLNASGTDTHSNACNGGSGAQCATGNQWLYAQGTNTVTGTHWTNDSNASFGPGQTSADLPSQPEGPTANVLCVIFADEAEGVPMSGYTADPATTAANTGTWEPDGLTTGSYPEFGNSPVTNSLNQAYHHKIVGSGQATAQTWEAATGKTGGTDLTDLWKYDVLRSKAVISNHQSSGTIKTYVYPATISAADSQRTFGLHILGAITTGTMAAGTAPTASGTPSTQGNPSTNYTKLGDMSVIESSNPYSTIENGRFGNLDQLNFGCSIESNGFDAWRFEQDLETFLLSGTGSQCDQTDCVKVRVVDSDTGLPISGHSVDIGGTNYVTNAQGYTPFVTGIANPTIEIAGCLDLPLYRDCRQHLVTLKYFSYTHTPNTICTYGCTDNTTVNGCGLGCNGALNYDPNATVDDGSCIYCVYGCTNPLSLNYNAAATCDDGSCQVMPDTAECLLKDISKQLLEDCTDLCETNDKVKKLRSDLQYAESLLAQFYQMYKCDTANGSSVTNEAYTKIFAAFRKLFAEYQCENCGEYHPGQTGIVTSGSGSTSTNPADCEVDFGGNCTSLIADPGKDVVSAVTSTDGGATWTSMGNPPNIVNLGNVVGKIAQEKHLCYDDFAEVLESCGMATIGINTKVYVFYDGTSLGQSAVQGAYQAVMNYLDNNPDFTPVMRDPAQQRNFNHLNSAGTYQAYTYGTTPGENVFHISVQGERWLDWAMVPITGTFGNNACPSASNTWGNGGSGASNYQGGSLGDVMGASRPGTDHEKGLGHKAADVAGYSYVGASGTVTGSVNHWVGDGVNLAGTTSGNPSDSNLSGVPWEEYPLQFASLPSGCGSTITSLSKPDGVNFNNPTNELRVNALWPFYAGPFGRGVQAINWSFNQWKNQTTMALTSGATIIPVQMYCSSSYDTATSKGPKGHSVYQHTSTQWGAPNTWVKLAEEADTATANNTSDMLARSKANCVHLGPPPAADPNNDDVLVIMFADESQAAYHGAGGSNPTFVDSFQSTHPQFVKQQNPYLSTSAVATAPFPNLATVGLNNNKVTQPTHLWKLDYMEFIARREAYVATAGKSYKAFLYPSKPTTGFGSSHKSLPLQAVAGISNGTNTPADGEWAAGTAPTTTGTYNFNSPYPDPVTGVRDKCQAANLTALEGSNPYWNTTDHPVPAGNPLVTNWGGLEDFGFGVNSQCRAFSLAQMSADLDIFLGQGGTACTEVNCVNFEIVNDSGVGLAGKEVNINGVTYTTDANGRVTHAANAALSNIAGPSILTFGFAGAETFNYNLPGDCSEYSFKFIYGESAYDVCVTYPEVDCNCGGGSGSITINTGSNTPLDDTAPPNGTVGYVKNETTQVTYDLTTAMITGSAPNIKVVLPFNLPTSDIPDGRYTLYLESIGGAPWRECKLILCDATTRLQNLFKTQVSNIKCGICDKVGKDFLTAYTLWRALKTVGWDMEYAAYIDTNIKELQTALTAAESGNCKCC